jgi:hypothetical protein
MFQIEHFKLLPQALRCLGISLPKLNAADALPISVIR